MASDSGVGKKGRGRPSVLDMESVGAIALELWNEHGYTNVGWADIAQASGVSVRTLTRHFDSKSALAWVGSTRSTSILARCLNDAPPHAEIHEVIVEAIAQSIEKSVTIELSGNAWIRAVASIPEITATANKAFEPWVEVLSDFIGRRVNTLQVFQCVAIANAYQAATLASMLYHATAKPSGSIIDTVRSGISPLRIASL